MAEKIMETIFSEGSRTFSNSSRFFPGEIREDVIKIYGLVRVADNFVDAIPQKKKQFYDFWELYKKGLKSGRSGNVVIDNFLDVMKRKNFKKEWVDGFFSAMEMDLKKKSYKTMKELDRYLYGSCEVVGLMMARVMNLPKEADIAAKYLGRGMQYINFIRDIKEDLDLGRNYFPKEDMKACGLRTMQLSEAKKHPDRFIACVRKQIARYFEWTFKGRQGFKHIPRRLLIPIKTASDMYSWTARKVYEDPFIVFREKVKPSKTLILWHGMKNLVNPYSETTNEEEVDSRRCKYDRDS